MNASDLLGIVLSGGRSSRMGQDKSTLAHTAGNSFLQHAIDRFDGICDRVFVCGGETDRATVLADQTPGLGPIGGIVTALEHAQTLGCAACFVTPVDMPLLTANYLWQLCQSWQATEQLTVAISETEQRLQPLVAIYPTSIAQAMTNVSQSDDRSLMRWLSQQRLVTIPLSDTACQNINTPEDFAQWSGWRNKGIIPE